MTVTARQCVLAWAPAVLYMLLIWALSSMSHVIVNFERVPFQDKGAHFVEYGILAALVAHALRGTAPQRQMLWVVTVSIAAATIWGVIDEIHQAYVPGRVSDARDLLADALGASLGALLWAMYRARANKRVRAG